MLILLRHGRTKANAAGLLQGRIDPGLDDLGVAQARAAAQHIGDVDRVISSPLVRAQQTAAALGKPIETDERWIELDYGDWDGTPVKSVHRDTWTAWRSDLTFRPPNGETLAELSTRVRTALDELLLQAADETIVVVSHVSPIKAATAWALGVDDSATWNMFLGQASTTTIAIGPNGPRLVQFNMTDHLPSVS